MSRPAHRSISVTWRERGGEPHERAHHRGVAARALVQAFRQALSSLGVPGRVVVTDVNPLSPAVHVADRAYRVPLAHDSDYLPELLKICEAEHIGLAVPTIDDEVELFGAARQTFADLGVLAACSPRETAAACNDKYATWRTLAEHGISAARTYLPDELPAQARFPLFIKPRVGRGAVGAHVIRNQRELDFFLTYVDRPVVQEYLDSPEYTIDVLCDLRGRPIHIVPREQVVIRAGVIDRGRTVKWPALIELAEQTCTAMRFVGAINIQCRLREGWPAIFRRHSADDCRRCRFSEAARQDGIGRRTAARHWPLQGRHVDDEL
jgi:carbamoyl-phosphate synthase large subunit